MFSTSPHMSSVDSKLRALIHIRDLDLPGESSTYTLVYRYLRQSSLICTRNSRECEQFPSFLALLIQSSRLPGTTSFRTPLTYECNGTLLSVPIVPYSASSHTERCKISGESQQHPYQQIPPQGLMHLDDVVRLIDIGEMLFGRQGLIQKLAKFLEAIILELEV